MNHYRRQLILSARAADVYRAIATQQGLRSWWTETCDVDDKVGGRARLECYEACNAGWNLFLGSLQALVETGQGAPWAPSMACSEAGAQA